MFVSVHMIVKENSLLGREFLKACFTSLAEAYFPSELIIVDNGSSDFIFDLYNEWTPKFNAFDCELKLFKSELTSFSDLRNLCIEKTYKNADYFFWTDSDECAYPEDLDILKNQTVYEIPNICQIWTSFYHFMLSPHVIQVNPDNMKYGKTPTNNDARNSKDNMFRFHPKIAWKKEEKVHEHVCNKLPGVELASGMEYLHFGYIRSQVVTCCKWLSYAKLQYGNLDCYKKERITRDIKTGKEVHNKFEGQDGYRSEVVEYFRNWRNPSTLCDDRRRVSMPYPMKPLTNKDYLPEAFEVLKNGCNDYREWNDYINKLDPKIYNFWERWQSKYKECNNKWSETLDWALETARKEEIY